MKKLWEPERAQARVVKCKRNVGVAKREVPWAKAKVKEKRENTSALGLGRVSCGKACDVSVASAMEVYLASRGT